METFTSLYEERIQGLEQIKQKIKEIIQNKQENNLTLLKEILRIIQLEKKRENCRKIKEETFIETFFVMKGLSKENKK